ncbi:hypothetical protein TNCV_914531 [Trichonephila clavipes]|nr:hypothetical protein TNCV_914531 [Trichonephila clavipes]
MEVVVRKSEEEVEDKQEVVMVEATEVAVVTQGGYGGGSRVNSKGWRRRGKIKILRPVSYHQSSGTSPGKVSKITSGNRYRLYVAARKVIPAPEECTRSEKVEY